MPRTAQKVIHWSVLEMHFSEGTNGHPLFYQDIYHITVYKLILLITQKH